jgi:hypothetical protein
MNEVLIFVLGAFLPYVLKVLESLVMYMRRELEQEKRNEHP